MSLLQAMRRHAHFRADQIAMIEDDTRHGWRAFEDRVLRLATGLINLGVSRGERVGILALNSIAYQEAEFAIWSAGAAAVPMNIRWSTAENAYAITDSDIRVLFVDKAFHAEGEALRAERPDLAIIRMDADCSHVDASETLIALSERASELEPDADALAAIFYTGGTTGHPKGVMLSHNALWANGLSVAMSVAMDEEDRILHTAPLFHVAGACMQMAGMISGCTHIFSPKFVAQTVIADIDRHAVTKLLILPTMIQMMLEHDSYEPEKLRTLDTLLFGGSPMPQPLLARLKTELPRVAPIHTYGQTEMGPAIAYLHPRWQFMDSPKGLSVGKPFCTVEAKVVDSQGRSVPHGTPGEVWARGPGRMLGYLNKPAETAEAMTPDGWVRTGDIAYQDADGYLYICDRAKDMIISGGENVFSGEVENALLQHSAVRQVAVVGIPDATYGEAVHAVLVLHDGHTIDLQRIRDHCRAIIAPYKAPRSIEVRDAMPLSPAGKILKRELRAPHWAAEPAST